MGFISYMKGLINRLFAVRDIQTAMNIEIVQSELMINKIDIWNADVFRQSSLDK